MKSIVLCLMVVVASLRLLADPSIDLKLIPSNILPGTAASVVVDVLNDDSAPVSVPTYIVMRVSPAAGSSFLATPSSFSDATPYVAIPEEFFVVDDQDRPEFVTLESGQRLTFEIPLNDAAFFGDRRLHSPGAYDVSVAFGSIRSQPTTFSTPARLLIEEPVGPDRAVWDMLLEESAARAGVGTTGMGPLCVRPCG